MRQFSTIPEHTPVLLLMVALLVGCGRGVPLSADEKAYLDRVAAVEVPLRLEPDDRDTVMARAVDWIDRYSVYDIATRGDNFVQTETPRSASEGGIGYRVEANVFDGVLTVDIAALRPDRFGGQYPVPDPTVEKMLGLYILEGILPPNDRVGFDEGRR